MKIVYAYNWDKAKGVDAGFNELTELVGKTGKSFNVLLNLLKENDHATVEVVGKGYKEISVENGKQFIQRNFVCEY